MSNSDLEEAKAEVKRWSDCLLAAMSNDPINAVNVAIYERQLKDANKRLEEANAIHLATINLKTTVASAGKSIS